MIDRFKATANISALYLPVTGVLLNLPFRVRMKPIINMVLNSEMTLMYLLHNCTLSIKIQRLQADFLSRQSYLKQGSSSSESPYYSSLHRYQDGSTHVVVRLFPDLFRKD